MLKKTLLLLVTTVFLLVASFGFAAEQKAAKKYYVIQDKNGVCSVRQAAKAPKAIAGPFDVKAEAEKAKSEKCPAKKKKS